MSMFGGSSGGWALSSESDPRWNCSGKAKCLMFSAGLPEECEKKIAELEEKYGEKPKDLEFSGMKD